MDFDILKIYEESSTIKAEGNHITSHRQSTIQRNGVRRFEKGKIFQTSRLGEASMDRLIADTKEWGGPGTPRDFELAPAHQEERKNAFADASTLNSFKEALEYLSGKYTNFIFSGQCSVSNKKISLNSSYGVDLSTEGGVTEWYFIYQKKGSGNMMDGYLQGVSVTDNILRSIQNQELFIQGTLKSAKMQSGRIPVLLADAKAPMKKLTESFHVNKYKENAALYSNKLGQKLFHEKVTLLDSACDLASGQLLYFDGEGVVRNHDLELISSGRFQNLIADLRFGKKFGMPSSGNGIRPYNRGVNLDFRALNIQKQHRKWIDIVRDLPLCLVAFLSVGGDSNDLGEYSAPVQVGYVFQFGELVGLAPQVSIKTSVDQYLGTALVDVSSDGFTPDMTSACIVSEMDVVLN